LDKRVANLDSGIVDTGLRSSRYWTEETKYILDSGESDTPLKNRRDWIQWKQVLDSGGADTGFRSNID
jgi:hypothetical protein